jgi:hypothetical protein
MRAHEPGRTTARSEGGPFDRHAVPSWYATEGRANDNAGLEEEAVQ